MSPQLSGTHYKRENLSKIGLATEELTPTYIARHKRLVALLKTCIAEVVFSDVDLVHGRAEICQS